MRNLILILLLASPAYATTYTFSGEGGLSGSFFLDDSTPLVVSVSPSGVILGAHTSPLNRLIGTLGNESFDVPVSLGICDVPSTWWSGDFWIIRTPAPDDRQPHFLLSLFIYWPTAGHTIPMSIAVPDHLYDRVDFQYTYIFPDSTQTGGQLFTLEQVPQVQAESVQVPEVPSVALLAVGLLLYSYSRLRLCR